eukprot:Nk52_evm4s313 gene=Nk52_evmTU4s313
MTQSGGDKGHREGAGGGTSSGLSLLDCASAAGSVQERQQQHEAMQREFLSEVFDVAAFRRRGHALVDYLAGYLEECHETKKKEGGGEEGCVGKVIPTVGPEEALGQWRKVFERSVGGGAGEGKNPGEEEEEEEDPLMSFLVGDKGVFPQVTKIHHGRNMGHQVGTPAPTAILATFFGDVLNNGTSIFEQGAAVVCLERLLCEWLAGRIGWTTGSAGGGAGVTAEGVFTSGGSLGNLTALLCARENYHDKLHPHKDGASVWMDGLLSLHTQLAFLVSSESHYSVTRSIRIMGMGSAGLIHVPVREGTFQMDVEAMERIYLDHLHQQEERVEGQGGPGIRTVIIGVVASAPSTSSGTFEDLKGIGRFCERYGLWMHVDAAHGGGFLLCDDDEQKKDSSATGRHLLNGIQYADSVLLDFHKMMLTPSLCSAVLLRNRRRASGRGGDEALPGINRERVQSIAEQANHLFHCFNGRRAGTSTKPKAASPHTQSTRPCGESRRATNSASLLPGQVTNEEGEEEEEGDRVHYLPIQTDWFNIVGRSFECTKPMLALRVYSLLHVHGDKIFAQYCSTLLRLTGLFAELLLFRDVDEAEEEAMKIVRYHDGRTDRVARGYFELPVYPPQCNIICFRYLLREGDRQMDEELMDRIQVECRRRIVQGEGVLYFVQTVLRGRVYLRCALMSPFTRGDHLRALRGRVASVAREIYIEERRKSGG